MVSALSLCDIMSNNIDQITLDYVRFNNLKISET